MHCKFTRWVDGKLLMHFQSETSVFSGVVWSLYLFHHPSLEPAVFALKVNSLPLVVGALFSCGSFSSGARGQSAATLYAMKKTFNSCTDVIIQPVYFLLS